MMEMSNLTTGMEKSSIPYSDSMDKAIKKDTMADNKEIQVYKWSIETELGTFTGTCLSMDGVNEEIALLTNNAKILKKNIIPESLVHETLQKKVYTWNVITNSGHASGVSVNLEEAKRVINSFGSIKGVKSNITETHTSTK